VNVFSFATEKFRHSSISFMSHENCRMSKKDMKNNYPQLKTLDNKKEEEKLSEYNNDDV
jgi:hypothetical protein